MDPDLESTDLNKKSDCLDLGNRGGAFDQGIRSACCLIFAEDSVLVSCDNAELGLCVGAG
jgi:hypothetical protein